MLNKIILTEEFLSLGKFPLNLSNIDIDKLKSICYENIEQAKPFLLLPDDYNLIWLSDYIRQKAAIKHKITLGFINKYAIIQKKDVETGFQHHYDEKNLKQSPDIVALYCLQKNDLEQSIIFRYKTLRQNPSFHKINLKESGFLIFNSTLDYALTPNNSDKENIYLALEFHILDTL